MTIYFFGQTIACSETKINSACCSQCDIPPRRPGEPTYDENRKVKAPAVAEKCVAPYQRVSAQRTLSGTRSQFTASWAAPGVGAVTMGRGEQVGGGPLGSSPLVSAQSVTCSDLFPPTDGRGHGQSHTAFSCGSFSGQPQAALVPLLVQPLSTLRSRHLPPSPGCRGESVCPADSSGQD